MIDAKTVLRGKRLLSLDVFDTLLFRLVRSPRDIFTLTGKKAAEAGILPASISPDAFRQLRVNAAAEAREFQFKKNSNREVTLDDIYVRMSGDISNVEALKKIELQTEADYCYINPEVENWIQWARKKKLPVVLVSDMYLSANQIKYLLDFNGCNSAQFVQVFVSNEHRCSKENGKLFERVCADFRHLSKHEIIHVGDNWKSDIESAKSYGLSTFFYDVIPRQLTEVLEYENTFSKNIPGELASLRKLSVSSFASSPAIDDPFFKIGASVLSPALTYFCEWVIDICERESKTIIHPFMREANTFGPMLEAAAKERNLTLSIVPLYVSRAATEIASFDQWDQETCENVMDRYGMTVGGALRFLEIPETPPSFSEFYDGYLNKSNESECIPQKIRVAFKDFLLSESVSKQVTKLITIKRERLIKYLKQTCRDPENSITVDLGFRGTIHQYLQKACKHAGVLCPLTHLLMIGMDSLEALKKRGLDIRGFLAEPNLNQDIALKIRQSSFALEQLLTGTTGTTLGYQVEGPRLEPEVATHRLPTFDFEAKTKTVQGILHYQQIWLKTASRRPFLRALIHDKEGLLSMLHRLIALPTASEANMLGELTHDANGGTDYTRKICNSSDEAVFENCVSVENFLETSRSQGVHWPEGIVTKNAPNALYKLYVEGNATHTPLSAMVKLLKRSHSKGIKVVMIYGAGDAGKTMLQAARMVDIEVECFIDRKATLWNTTLDGVPVISLAEALELFKNTPIAIGSFAFIPQIKADIKTKTEEIGQSVDILSIGSES